jgi:hypothetical protein
MATWPASLPQVVPADEFEESAEDNRIRTDVDAGPAKVRPRYSAEVVRVRFDLRLTLTQVGTLETFYKTTLGYGADAFDWTDPRTGAACEFRFINRPAYRNIGGARWRTGIELERLP